MFALLFCFCVILLATIRLFAILPNTRATSIKRTANSKCSLAVFLGSGGHTTEALALVSALDFNRYHPRTYIISDGDNLSAKKAESLEISKAPTSGHEREGDEPDYAIIRVPRARRVHQSLLTTPFSSLWSLLHCAYYVKLASGQQGQDADSHFDVLLVNGPGTCFILCFAIYIHKFLGFSSPKIIYVESFARVKSLSLSGKLLKPFVDLFIIQWPGLASGRNVHYSGWLV